MNIKLKLFFCSILILVSSLTFSLTFSEEPLTDSLEAIGFSESLVTTIMIFSGQQAAAVFQKKFRLI